MRVEHVQGGGSAAYAFLQLDDFLVAAFPSCFDVFSLSLSLSLSNTRLSPSGIQFATVFNALASKR